MSKFEKASRMKLRFETQFGVLTVEQLWDLSLNKLGNVIRDVAEELSDDSENDKLSFLDIDSSVDEVVELKFDILKQIYTIKKAEVDAEKESIENKIHNEAIMSMIHKKEQESLENLTIDELKAKLK